MKRLILLSALMMGTVTAAQAGVRLSVGFGLPLPGVAASLPAPVYYTVPAPVYQAPPVYYAAPPAVYVAPPSIVLGVGPGYYGYRGHGPAWHGYRHYPYRGWRR